MDGYSVTIREISKQVSAKVRVMLKDTSNAIPLDEATRSGNLIIDPDFYAILDVHNERSGDKDYVKYVIVDEDGTKYVTGSESFMSSFISIMGEMADCDEPFSVEVYRKPSKNYSGKEFITCSII